jgi:3-oxoacyl-[acyl-carrier-protein] synthase III
MRSAGTEAPRVHIVSAGTALPGPPIDNAMLAERFGLNELWRQWVDAFIGTRTRHYALDLETGDMLCSLADLGTTAGKRALEAAGVAASAVDIVVLGTSTPDQLMPATVNMIADRLGIDGVPTYQLQAGCSGAVQALDVAAQMLRTGRHRTALVIGGDVVAKHMDFEFDASQLSGAEQISGILFGDGGGAAVLSVESTPDSVVLCDTMVRLAGLGRAPGHTVEWFGLRDLNKPRASSNEDYKAVEESVPEMSVEMLRTLLDELDWKDSDLDYLLPPQLSGRMTAQIVERMAVPGAREVSCVVETGNTGNALPFFQLERLMPQMTSGQRAVAVAIESSKWIKSGFAVEKA